MTEDARVEPAAWGAGTVNLHKRAIVLPLAGLLLVGAAGAVIATTGDAPARAATVVPAAVSPTPSPSTGPGKAHAGTALADALDSLVADGTITSGQKAKILDAVAAERQSRLDAWKALAGQRKADRQVLKADRQVLKADRQVLKDALADGQITQDELDKLSADNPLRKATDLMSDGKITKDELKGLWPGMSGKSNKARGGGHGWWSAKGPKASASPTSGG
jgi:hypothetical protein